MELKKYQQEVINDLVKYLEEIEKTNNISKAFSNFWENEGYFIHNIENDYLQPYDNSITGVPRVTVKVPTAGGKTFIACNALKPIFDHFPIEKPKVVVWFVPSDTILKQTYKNLKDTRHPYRQKIDSHFGSAVEVYNKEALLFGQGFNPTEVREQVSILVLSVQSFVETVRKGKPRAYRENENLADFVSQYRNLKANLQDVDDTALIQVIAYLSPVIIIDESHNFEADLRIDMLKNINPSFIFDLTATPRNKSNIISFVDAHKLKKNNMVKLPVIVYNHQDTNEVINSAIQMQKTLEAKAKKLEQEGGKYIRPIVLFQAQPKTASDNITFEKIKENLIDIGIPQDQIRIKTANIDEIKSEELMSRDCEVRYIITVNALKEGWDCSFAYILASLANKTSSIDVEQILGRVLRLPYVTEHKNELLNYSYVFTSSSDFLNTLDKIVAGLNKSGFSAKDYRVKDAQVQETEKERGDQPLLGGLFDSNSSDGSDSASAKANTDVEIDPNKVKSLENTSESEKRFNDILNVVKETGAAYDKEAEASEQDDTQTPNELKDVVKTYPIKKIFKEEVKGISIPTFHIKTMPNLLAEQLEPLTKGLLLKGFNLDEEDIKIDLTKTSSKMAAIDLVEGRENEFTPEFKHVENHVREQFAEYIATLSPEGQVNQLAGQLAKIINKIDTITAPQIESYIHKILTPLSTEKIAEIRQNVGHYSSVIKKKINSLTDAYAEKQFSILLDKGTIVCQPFFKFRNRIQPKSTQKGITKNLYIEEGEMNSFERKVINEVANLDSVVYWHRNLERGKGLLLNGFINHYPDFIVQMKDGKTILIETKGDHLDGSDSQQKIRLGNYWASKAGNNYRYFMVFESDKLDGSRTVGELIDIIKDMK